MTDYSYTIEEIDNLKEDILNLFDTPTPMHDLKLGILVLFDTLIYGEQHVLDEQLADRLKKDQHA